MPGITGPRCNEVRRGKNMYLVEKIGNLILVTFEGELGDEEIETIKTKLKKIGEVATDDVVVSFNFSKRCFDSSILAVVSSSSSGCRVFCCLITGR